MIRNKYLCFITILAFTNIIDCKKEKSVIIIGAGASGIAAATRLLKNGFNNLIILEAENRTGGRLYSVKLGKSYVDLGAEWCHGQNDNTVYNLVKDLNILEPSLENYPILFHSKWKVIDTSFKNQLFDIFEEIYNEDRKGLNISLGKYIGNRFNKTVEKIWGNDSNKLNIAFESIQLFEKWVLSYEGAFSWFSVAADSDFVETEGNQQLCWMGRGYKTILDVLMQKYPNPKQSLPIDDKILLEKEVIQIVWNASIDDEAKVIVRCSDDSEYVADHVIVTVSLGVLKHKFASMLIPALPKKKARVIEDLGFDAVFKAFFKFDKRWWNDTFQGYSIVWSSNDLKDRNTFSDGPVKDGKSWITSVLAIYPVPCNDNILAAWFTGEFVPEIEQCSDKIIIDGFMYLISKFALWNYTDLVKPEKVMRNGWFSNPHFKGTYTYETLKSQIGTQSRSLILSEPLISRTGKTSVLFAGEATHPKYFSTVHGAIDSGFREADRLILFYKTGFKVKKDY